MGAAFVGYIVQANGIHFGWPQTMAGDMPPFAGGSPEAQWNAIPLGAKWQGISFVAFLELWGEAAMDTHNMQLPHPVPLNLFDPFKLSKNASPEKKAKGLLA